MSHEAAFPEIYVPSGHYHRGPCKLHNIQYCEPHEHKGKEFGENSLNVLVEFIAYMDENVH